MLISITYNLDNLVTDNNKFSKTVESPQISWSKKMEWSIQNERVIAKLCHGHLLDIVEALIICPEDVTSCVNIHNNPHSLEVVKKG